MSVPFWAAFVLLAPYLIELAIGLYFPAFLGKFAFWEEPESRVPGGLEGRADRTLHAATLQLDLHPSKGHALVTTVGGFRNRAVGAMATIIRIDLRVDEDAVVLAPRVFVFPFIGFIGLPIAVIVDLAVDASKGRDVSFAGAAMVVVFVVGIHVLARLGSRRATATKLAWARERIASEVRG